MMASGFRSTATRLLAVLIGAAFFTSEAAVTLTPAPLCRVTAEVEPMTWGFYRLTVALRPDCPPNGIARIRLGHYGGWGSQAVGPIKTLNAARPSLYWAAQPEWRTVQWLAQSGKPYEVPLREVRR